MADYEGIFISGAATSKRDTLRVADAMAEVYGLNGVCGWTLAEAVENPRRLAAVSGDKVIGGHSTGVEIMNCLRARHKVGIDGAALVPMDVLIRHSPRVLIDAVTDVLSDKQRRYEGLGLAVRSFSEVVVRRRQHIEAIRRLPSFDVADQAARHAEAGLSYTLAVHCNDAYFPPNPVSLERARKAGVTVCELAGNHTSLLFHPDEVLAQIKDIENLANNDHIPKTLEAS